MQQRNNIYQEPKPQKCCCCFELNTGMTVMGYFTIFNCVCTLLISVTQISEGMWHGAANLVVSIPWFLLGYYYYQQMQEDSRENRHKVSKGYKYVLISTALILLALFILVLAIPADEYPD